jgi:hypothetical protein
VWLEYFVLSQEVESRGVLAFRLLLDTSSPTLLLVQGSPSNRELELLFWVYSTSLETYEKQEYGERLSEFLHSSSKDSSYSNEFILL